MSRAIENMKYISLLWLYYVIPVEDTFNYLRNESWVTFKMSSGQLLLDTNTNFCVGFFLKV